MAVALHPHTNGTQHLLYMNKYYLHGYCYTYMLFYCKKYIQTLNIVKKHLSNQPRTLIQKSYPKRQNVKYYQGNLSEKLIVNLCLIITNLY